MPRQPFSIYRDFHGHVALKVRWQLISGNEGQISRYQNRELVHVIEIDPVEVQTLSHVCSPALRLLLKNGIVSLILRRCKDCLAKLPAEKLLPVELLPAQLGCPAVWLGATLLQRHIGWTRIESNHGVSYSLKMYRSRETRQEDDGRKKRNVKESRCHQPGVTRAGALNKSAPSFSPPSGTLMLAPLTLLLIILRQNQGSHK